VNVERGVALLGSQTPTHRLAPDHHYSRGDEVIELAEMAGLVLDPYQRDFLIDGCACVEVESQLELDAGATVERWAAFEVGIELSRQNGKSVAFEARCLAGLYLFREELIVYTAHKGETAMAAFERMEQLIRSDPELLAEVRPNGFRRANGKEAILLRPTPECPKGQTLKFRTRTAGGGRGLAGDCVILDEAQDLRDDHLAALFPVLSARPNPQLWYGGSAGEMHSTVQGRLVRRCAAGDARLVYYRWALPEDADPNSEASWARVNPAVGRRMTLDFIASEQRAMSIEKFSRERLGQGTYPRAEGEDWTIPRTRIEAAIDEDSKPFGPVVFSIEVARDRAHSSISLAGRRRDGQVHYETVANEAGSLWVVDELVRLLGAHANLGVIIDPGSPANTLLGPLKDAGIFEAPKDPGPGKAVPRTKIPKHQLRLLSSQDLTQAFGDFYDAHMAVARDDAGVEVPSPTYHFTGGTALISAFAEATVRNLIGSTTWSRVAGADVTPALSATWACHALKVLAPPRGAPTLPRRARSRTTSRETLASVGF
jgi:hypothetical protein